MEQLYKKVIMALMAIIMAVSFSACSDDDENGLVNTGFGDYYSVCESVGGDQLTAQEQSEIQTAVNSAISGTWNAVELDRAKYAFEEEVDMIAEVLEELYDEEDFRGTIHAIMALKETKSGNTVYRKTITVDKNGALVK